jgi:RND family efflux transporter, MFP subunit
MPVKAVLVLLVLAALSLAGCAQKTPPPADPAPVEVGVITITPRPVTLTRELPGRTSAFRVAEVRARVSGIVLKRLFTEGSDVREGQPLYQIDPAPYQAALDSARAALARAEANAASARLLEQRSKQLLADKAISQQDYDNALAALQAGEADIAAAKAAVQTAEINLGYTAVTSPLSGRIGRSHVTEGAYVQAGAATLLATVQQIDPLYVDLAQSSTEVLRLRRLLAEGKLHRTDSGDARVQLLLDDGRPYGHEGSLQFSDVTVDPSTSSITLRAIFPNPEGELLPGMFVRARLAEGSAPEAILVPQFAVTRNAQGEAVALVVNAESKVESRVVKTPRTVGNQWLVSEGLAPGEQVIVENLQRIRPGSAVKPYPAQVPASIASAAK